MSDNFNKRLGVEISRHRNRLSMSQEQLAKLLGKSASAQSLVESGDRKVSAELIPAETITAIMQRSKIC